MPFRFEQLEIPEVILIEAKAFEDHRGYFVETYKRSDFEANGIPETLVQDNHSYSARGVLRGLWDVLGVLRVREPLTRIRFFLGRRKDLGNTTPLELLRKGELNRVIAAARTFAP